MPFNFYDSQLLMSFRSHLPMNCTKCLSQKKNREYGLKIEHCDIGKIGAERKIARRF